MTAPASPAALPSVRIAWNNCTIGEWNRLLAQIPRSTLTQSFAYGEAMLLTERWRPQFGLIERDDRPVGLVMALEKKLLSLATVVKIHRGPLWLAEGLEPAVMEAGLRALRQRYPARLVRWVTFLPELPAGTESTALLTRCGWRPTSDDPYRTIWVDLEPEPDILRQRLRRNWRHHLKQAEGAGLTVENHPEHAGLPWLIERYLDDRQARGYRGPSGPLAVRLRNALHKNANPHYGALLLRALDSAGQPQAGVFMLRHGLSATYQIGWNSPEGRRNHAHQLLLWQAMLALRTRGVRWLDLGGINPASAAGVTDFKRGLGGDEVELTGSYT